MGNGGMWVLDLLRKTYKVRLHTFAPDPGASDVHVWPEEGALSTV